MSIDAILNTLLKEVRGLASRVETFIGEKSELETLLRITTEHDTVIKDQLFLALHHSQQKLQALEQEKSDLEITLDTVTEITDAFQYDLLKSQSLLKQEISKRVLELAERNRLLQLEVRERKNAEIELQLAASVFQATQEAIMITDPAARIIKVNKAYTKLTGYAEEDVLGKKPNILKSGQHDPLFYQNMWESLSLLGHWSGEIWNRRCTEEVFPCWLSISAVKDESGKTTHYIGILTDITHQKLSEERIAHLAHYDALTDLPNRTLFLDRLEQILWRAQRDNQSVGLLYIDLDDFKDVNEAFGHLTGDLVLQITAQRLVKYFQGDKNILARVGGDEFTVLLDTPALKPSILQTAASIATQILEVTRQPILLSNHEIIVTASIGIAIFPQDSRESTELFKHADVAMDAAKVQERNAYRFYTHAADMEARERLTLQNCLHYAQERNELSLYYQPLIEIKTAEIIGFEALLRWHHPLRGIICPTKFIPIAENSGLIINIGQWVIKTACQQQRAWQEKMGKNLMMAVNLSVKQFYHKDLVNCIIGILKETEITPRHFILEITETLAMNDVKQSVKALHALKNLGFQLAIDDFGTGYSSLNYLQEFTVDELKIDSSFIARLHTPNGLMLVSSIIKMAHGLGLKVVAEGVETTEQLELLRQQGCDYAQGFLFSPPRPPLELHSFLITA